MVYLVNDVLYYAKYKIKGVTATNMTAIFFFLPNPDSPNIFWRNVGIYTSQFYLGGYF